VSNGSIVHTVSTYGSGGDFPSQFCAPTFHLSRDIGDSDIDAKTYRNGGMGEVAQIMYTHASNCKNDKFKK
jgi:hypothetical protein